ncbi:MAG: hypothetical protein IPJ32_12640 [Sphingobacteriaceae bacterium]|nr:hypothetical protein [Sphingobacteriaceae bacterium]
MKTIIKLSFIIALIVFACSKSNTEAGIIDSNTELDSNRSSVTFIKGNYKIDSAIITKNLNKKRLISNLETKQLSEKKTIQEVPAFIKDFLTAVSSHKKFDMVNLGEDWKSGITNYGHIVYKKVYDPNKKDSVLIMSGDGAILPDKQLIYFGLGDGVALLSYFRGGFGALQNVIMIEFKNETVTDFWFGSVFEGSIKTKNDILKNVKRAPRNNGC